MQGGNPEIQQTPPSQGSSPERSDGLAAAIGNHPRGREIAWMVADALTVLAAVVVATVREFHAGPAAEAKSFWHGTLIQGRPVWLLLALVCGYTATLLIVSRRLRLYEPRRITSILLEQKLSLQACALSGLLLMCTLYMLHGSDVPRGIVLLTVGLVTVTLGVRRLVYRLTLYRRFERGVDTRNVLIVGTGPEAHALRHHLQNIRHLGYNFKGFIRLEGEEASPEEDGDVVGSIETMFDQVRKYFVDEIFFTASCEPGVVNAVMKKARNHRVDLRVVPDLYDGLVWNSPVEYIGQFPTIPLQCRQLPEGGLVIKRVMDILFAGTVVLLISPLLLAVAIAIKLDSPGPIFYSSDRIGKRGNVFRCIKFRTMVRDADRRLAEIMHMNERDGVLFKVSNDPRITRLGRFLRKYSIDELPQFFNVLSGDMSVVGPRPPLASEVKEYKLNHLRRLDVLPGITGLWQVQGRKDPSFDNYVSLDMAYIENWTIWLDVKIILRTIGVVIAGTGS